MASQRANVFWGGCVGPPACVRPREGEKGKYCGDRDGEGEGEGDGEAAHGMDFDLVVDAMAC